MRTLVTGATGFIGSSFLENLNLDDVHTLSRHPRKISNAKVVHHIGDIQDQGFLNRLAKLKFDRVIHFAWKGLPSLTSENNSLNLKMSLDFFNIMLESGVREINVTGSCLEYGDLTFSVAEDISGSNVNEFGRTKLALLDYLEAARISYRWFRIFYAYGPNQHPSSLLYSVYQGAKKGIPIKIQNPNVSHDFIYVDDVARAIGMLLATPNSYGVFNIGSNKSNSVGKMANLLLGAMMFTEKTEDDEAECLRANIGKIQSICGWSPLISPDEGIKKFLDWCENQ